MTINYHRVRSRAKNILARGGQDGILRTAQGEYPVKLVAVDYSLHDVSSGVVAAGDRRVYMEGLDVNIIPNEALLYLKDQITGQMIAHKIIPPVRKIEPAGINVLFDLQVRR